MHRILFILSLVSSLFCFGQSLTIKTIDKTDLKPITYVKILVLDNDSSIITITSTNKNGHISLNIPYGSYTIKASHLAYEKWNQKVIFDSKNAALTIQLIPKVENLDEVLINASGYIRKHGDTTTVSLPKIVNGKERNVIDVLKKIKGVQVQDDGTVTYNKKEVNHVLINGNKIFDNDYKSALDKIRPHEMVKIQFIENYKDNTNSDLIAKDAMAMNLGFKDDFFISGTLEGGLGVSNEHILGVDLLQNAKWITSFINLKHQNIGFSESDNLSNTELLNTEIISHYEPYSSLATLNVTQLGKIDATNFNNTYTSRINTTVKLSKQTQLLIKSNNTKEELHRLNSVTSEFSIDDEPIIRNELTNQRVDYVISENNINILHKTEKSVLKTAIYFKSINHVYFQDIDLNGNINQQFIEKNSQQYNVDITYEQLLSNNNPLIINAGYHYKPMNQSIINQGFITLNQDFETRENVYYGNASLLKQQQDSSIIGIYFKSKLSGIKQNLNSQSNNDRFYSQEELMTSEVSLDWRKDSKVKNWDIKSGINLYTFNLDNGNSYLKFGPFFNASLKIKNNRTNHNFAIESANGWVLNNPFTPINIFDSYNSSYNINSTNDIRRKSRLSYTLSNAKNLDNISLSASLRHKSKSLLYNFSIDENSSRNSIVIIDKDTYSFDISAKYNTLFLKLFFLEVSINPSVGNSYITGNSSTINKITNNSYLTELKFNRRFSKQFFIGTTTQLQYREFKSNSSTNNVLNYNTKVYLTWEFGNFELKGDYDHIKLGEDVKAANFSSLYLTITPKKSILKGSLQLFNLFNTKTILTTSSSNLGEFSSSFSIPQRRLVASVTYSF